MRILVADDEPVSRALLQRTLERQGHEVVAVADGNAAIDGLLDGDAPRLAILDWMMPGADGLEVCRTIRENAEAYVYVILLTARDSAQDMVMALEAGADDFLRKPFEAAELRARLHSGKRILDLQEGLLEAQEALRRHATFDHLTGLWNRRMILEQLDRELNRVRRERCPLTIAVIDIDRFKGVNDAHGHAAGDAVLRDTAATVRTHLREYDFLGRYGGEEFLVILPGCDLGQGLCALERVRSTVAATSVRFGDLVIPVTVSIGLAATRAVGESAAELIHAADAALYAAKANGRNCIEVAAGPAHPA